MRAIGLKSYGLWSMSRGFARSSEQYYRYLSIADRPRQGGEDGRGILSDAGLVSFTEYFCGCRNWSNDLLHQSFRAL